MQDGMFCGEWDGNLEPEKRQYRIKSKCACPAQADAKKIKRGMRRTKRETDCSLAKTQEKTRLLWRRVFS